MSKALLDETPGRLHQLLQLTASGGGRGFTMRSDLERDFARLLVALGLPLRAVPDNASARYFLGVASPSFKAAATNGVRIVDRLLGADASLLARGLDCGDWLGRRVSGRVLIFWTGIEITRPCLAS